MPHTPLPTLTLDPELGFAAGTRIHTKDGLKAIETIRAGDWVLTHPEHTPPPRRRRQSSEYHYQQVSRVATVIVDTLVRITVKNMADEVEDSVLLATGQPLWTQPAGWVAAGNVGTGQAVVLSFNGNALVQSVQTSSKPTPMYWLEVEQYSSYYVEQLGVWVGCRADLAAQAASATPPKPPFDFTKPQLLVDIQDYYNDTLATPEPAALAPELDPELAEKMRASAEGLRKLTLEKLQLDLTYDEAGVRWLEGYIDRHRLRDPSSNEIQAIGAFLGECAVRNIGGQWARYDGMACVMFDKSNALFPHNKVSKQFKNGLEDSILSLYETSKSMQEARRGKALTPAQERLQEFVRRSDTKVFVRDTMDGTPKWSQVTQVNEDRFVQLLSPPHQHYTVSRPLIQIDCFYVCSPSGQLLHTEWINKSEWDTLPPDILRQLKSKLAADTSLTLSQLARGKQFIEITYGASNKKAEDRHYYATTLKNISAHKIQITRFGGFKPQGAAWQLASVTGDFYTAAEFKDWYGQKSDWLLPGETACDTANWGSVPVLWAYYGHTEAGESFVAGSVLEKPIANPASSSGAHFVKPVMPQQHMEAILLKLRASYELRQQRMNSITMASLMGPRPAWLKETDGLTQFFDQQALLLTEGHIVWGALVQANELLFKPGPDNCPALLVHSPDGYFDSRPQELRQVGSKFFSLKDTTPTDLELQEVARLVTDEMDRSMGFALPKVFSPKAIQSAAFMVFRQHLPTGVLSASVFPILTHPSTPAVMMVPFEFWPIELIVLWKEDRL